MAKTTKKRKSNARKKKKQANITLIVMLAIILVIIGVFVIKAITNDGAEVDNNTTTTEGVYEPSGDDIPDFSDDEKDEPTNETEAESTSEEQTEEASSTTRESTTEMMTLPMNNEPSSNVDIIITHYTDFMGFPEDSLYIKSSESKESARGYSYTLRVNLPGSPNKLIGDVYVEKGTGKVTDSMGNEPWYIED